MTMPQRLVLFFSLLLGHAYGQQTLPASEILAAALDAEARSAQREQLLFLQKTNHELPWVNQLELRTETDNLDWARQEYLFRLGFNSQEERYMQRRLHQQNIQRQEAKTLLVLQQGLMERYFLLANYYDLQKRRALRAQQQLVREDKLRVMQRLATETVDFELDDFISAEEDYHQVQQALLELDGAMALLENRLGMALQTSAGIVPDTSKLLSISNLQDIFAQLPASPTTHPRLREQQARIGQSTAEYDLEEAEAERVLDFVQLRYAGRDNLNFGQELSVGMAFKIPSKATQRLDLNELALERLEDEGRLRELEVSLTEGTLLKRQQLQFLLEKHALSTRQLAESQLTFSLENYPAVSSSEPLALLKMRESQLKRQLNLLDMEAEIFEAYLELIDLTGAVVEMPLRNYLSTDLELLPN